MSEPAVFVDHLLDAVYDHAGGGNELIDGIHTDPSPSEPRPDRHASLNAGAMSNEPGARWSEFGHDASVGRDERAAPGEKSDGVTADADVAVHEQHRPPPPFPGESVEDGSLQDGGASPPSGGDGARSGIDSQGDRPQSAQSGHHPAGTAAHVHGGSTDAC